jgi:Zn finger protein HypA/HybF involved in hydrogenase expression
MATELQKYEVTCPYCRNRMLEIVLGWQCPVCHATIGQEKAVSR